MALTTILGLVDVHRQTHPLPPEVWDGGMDYQPHLCPDEGLLVTLLHHCGMDTWHQAGTALRQGRVAVVPIVYSAAEAARELNACTTKRIVEMSENSITRPGGRCTEGRSAAGRFLLGRTDQLWYETAFLYDVVARRLRQEVHRGHCSQVLLSLGVSGDGGLPLRLGRRDEQTSEGMVQSGVQMCMARDIRAGLSTYRRGDLNPHGQTTPLYMRATHSSHNPYKI